MLTLGAAGAMVSGPGGVAEVPAEAAAVRDTTGAGDAFLGGALASALLRGGALDAEALRAGRAGGGGRGVAGGGVRGAADAGGVRGDPRQRAGPGITQRR